MIPENVIHKLKAVVGPEHVLASPEERWGYAYDATDQAHMPDLVVFPGSAAEIAALVRLANEHRFPVVPRGAGTGRSGGSVPIEGGVVLVLTRLNRILEISRPDLVAVVEPGVILSRLKQAVEAEGLILSPGPGQRRFLHHRRQRRRVRRGGGGGAVRGHPGLRPGARGGAAHRGDHHRRDPDHEGRGGL